MIVLAMGAIVFAMLLAAACGDLCLDSAVAHYAWLFAEAGYGRMPHERAGFLVRETDGTLTFAPFTVGDFASASHRGAVPRNAIALVHTHPSSHSPHPSANDLAMARKLAMPVLVVSRDAVIVATPDGITRELLRERLWFTSGERTPGRASGTGRDRSALRTFPLR